MGPHKTGEMETGVRWRCERNENNGTEVSGVVGGGAESIYDCVF